MADDVADSASCAACSKSLRPPDGGKPLRVLEDINLDDPAQRGRGAARPLRLRQVDDPAHPRRPDRADAGEVLYHGEPLEGLNPGVAIVFQSFALFPWMTVAENVEVGAASRRASTRRRPAPRRASAIRLVGLAGFEEAYPRELSGGMKQRVGMARALSVDPEMLFMDEPFSQVDALTAESLRAEVLDIWADRERNPSRHPDGQPRHQGGRLHGRPDRRPRRQPGPHPHRSSRTRCRARATIALGGLPWLGRPAPRHHHRRRDARRRPSRLPTAGVRSGRVEPLPNAQASEIVGLLDYLDRTCRQRRPLPPRPRHTRRRSTGGAHDREGRGDARPRRHPATAGAS